MPPYPTTQYFLIKIIVIALLSPLIGYVAIEIMQNLQKATKRNGVKRWLSLSIAGFLIAVLLGWLQ